MSEKVIPVFEWVIRQTDDRTGVDFVALVDEPAISMNWQKFKKVDGQVFVIEPGSAETQEEWLGRCIPYEINNGHEKDQAVAICYSKWENRVSARKFVADKERRIISGPLMVANLPIYRNDNGREYYGIFKADTIEAIAMKFMKNGFNRNVNLMHEPTAIVDGVYMFESFIIDKSRGINAPTGYGDLPDGTWFGSFKVENDEVWNEYIKTGVFKGFSVEGWFTDKPIGNVEEDLVNKLIDLILGSNPAK